MSYPAGTLSGEGVDRHAMEVAMVGPSPTPTDPIPAGPTSAGPVTTDPVGARLAAARRAAGLSQQRLAERLAAAAGRVTLGRHEVWRWEHGTRTPGPFWRGWLCTVLRLPPTALDPPVPPGRPVRDPPPDMAGLAHEWLLAGTPARRRPRPAVPLPAEPLPGLAARLAGLRRMDELLGGVDLYGAVRAEALRVRRLDDDGRLPRSALTAELYRLAGRLAADAGRPRAAERWHAVALRAARAAGDATAGGHVLCTLAVHLAETGDPHRAALLAHTGYAGARRVAPPGDRARLLHRLALVRALAGDGPGCRWALAAADRVLRTRPAGGPSPGRAAAVAGRCHAILGDRARALPALRTALRSDPMPARERAVCAGWLAETALAAGAVEPACAAARVALDAALTAGSVRATARVVAVHRRLTRAGLAAAPAQAFDRRFRAAHRYLPMPGTPGFEGVGACQALPLPGAPRDLPSFRS